MSLTSTFIFNLDLGLAVAVVFSLVTLLYRTQQSVNVILQTLHGAFWTKRKKLSLYLFWSENPEVPANIYYVFTKSLLHILLYGLNGSTVCFSPPSGLRTTCALISIPLCLSHTFHLVLIFQLHHRCFGSHSWYRLLQRCGALPWGKLQKNINPSHNNKKKK